MNDRLTILTGDCWCKVWVCGLCAASYAEGDMREGMQCISNLSKPGHGAFRCQGHVHREPCHADVLLEIANEPTEKA